MKFMDLSINITVTFTFNRFSETGVSMAATINKYFQKDSIYLLDDDDSVSENIGTTGDIDINQYFSRDSIFYLDEDDRSGSKKRSTFQQDDGRLRRKESDPYRTGKNLDYLRSPTSGYSPSDVTLRENKVNSHNNKPTISVQRSSDDLEESNYDVPPPVTRQTFPRSKRKSSYDGDRILRESTPILIGNWERNSQSNFENLFANEGNESNTTLSLPPRFSWNLKTKPRDSKYIVPDNGVLYKNRAYISLSDSSLHDIQKEEEKQMQRHADVSEEMKMKSRRCEGFKKLSRKAFQTLKDGTTSAVKNIRGTLQQIRNTPYVPFGIHSHFCIPAGYSNVSSMAPNRNGQCWISAEKSNIVILCDRKGQTLDVVPVGCPVDCIAIDNNDNLYMSCPSIKEVRMFDTQRRIKTLLDMTQCPRGIAYNPMDDTIFVCRNNVPIANDLVTKSCNSLRKYSLRHKNKRTTGQGGIADTMFGYPLRVCVNVNNDCIVSDFAHRSVTVLDCIGRVRFSFKSSNDFVLRNRHSIACDSAGNIYIFSKGPPNTCVLESNGTIKDIFSIPEMENEFLYASVFDSDGYLWIACMDGIVKIFKKDGNC